MSMIMFMFIKLCSFIHTFTPRRLFSTRRYVSGKIFIYSNTLCLGLGRTTFSFLEAKIGKIVIFAKKWHRPNFDNELLLMLCLWI